MSTEYILECKDIKKTYSLGKTRLQVLKGLDMNVAAGEFLAIVGSSGSGKSTLLHIAGALDLPDDGTISFKGKELTKMSSRQLNRFRNKSIGFVFQFYHLLDELSLAENVMLPAMAAASTLGWLKIRLNVKKKAKSLLKALAIDDRADHKPYQLSGGQRQRAAIARALINSPDILLADEPTGNLDAETGNGILEVFRQLHSDGQTIVMVTHDQVLADTADRSLRLADGLMKQE